MAIENEKIILTNEVVIPSATERGSPIEDKVIYVQSTGDTIFEAYRNATLEFDRKLYVPHNMIVIFGEEFAKRGIGDYMVDFINDSEPRETAYMLVAKNDKAYNLLGINGGIIVFEVPDEKGGHLKHVATKGQFTTIEIISSRTKKDINKIFFVTTAISISFLVIAIVIVFGSLGVEQSRHSNFPFCIKKPPFLMYDRMPHRKRRSFVCEPVNEIIGREINSLRFEATSHPRILNA